MILDQLWKKTINLNEPVVKGVPQTSKPRAKNADYKHPTQSEGALFNINQDLVRRLLWATYFIEN